MWFTAKGLDHIAEQILSYLDARSLCSAELVSKAWNRVISDGMLWRKLIEHKVLTDPLWRGLSERRGWCVLLHLASKTVEHSRFKWDEVTWFHIGKMSG